MTPSWSGRAAVAALALILNGCATLNPREAPALRQQGQAFVERACAGCHAVERTGASRNPDAPPFRELAAARSDAELTRAIGAISRDGHVEMPPIYVTPDEMRAVVAYLHSLRDRGA